MVKFVRFFSYKIVWMYVNIYDIVQPVNIVHCYAMLLTSSSWNLPLNRSDALKTADLSFPGSFIFQIQSRYADSCLQGQNSIHIVDYLHPSQQLFSHFVTTPHCIWKFGKQFGPLKHKMLPPALYQQPFVNIIIISIYYTTVVPTKSDSDVYFVYNC